VPVSKPGSGGSRAGACSWKRQVAPLGRATCLARKGLELPPEPEHANEQTYRFRQVVDCGRRSFIIWTETRSSMRSSRLR
jgi:hypothetical protein